ncbi:uncharacterized protein LY89DRAFT_127129 [Mollisia scopiformis]|uniref:Uncharacterized protein n=1 Tax=Mollisia scopiformis TaxID=149040 RepID=A0A194X471_MOLSC|nr:uncharacterized protein LY89DRAFT_127129 [Mollisia scopiformis]KUJ14978.1 hypothetical protein LY89DRAFT_127129 [Mollisia scopiformis]
MPQPIKTSCKREAQIVRQLHLLSRVNMCNRCRQSSDNPFLFDVFFFPWRSVLQDLASFHGPAQNSLNHGMFDWEMVPGAEGQHSKLHSKHVTNMVGPLVRCDSRVHVWTCCSTTITEGTAVLSPLHCITSAASCITLKALNMPRRMQRSSQYCLFHHMYSSGCHRNTIHRLRDAATTTTRASPPRSVNFRFIFELIEWRGRRYWGADAENRDRQLVQIPGKA